MKIAGARALSYCQKPKRGDHAALIFGSDPGLVSSSAETLTKAKVKDLDPTNLVRLTDDDLKADEARLADELVARSMFGGDRIVRVRMEKETQAKKILDILSDIDAGTLIPEAFLIVEGKELGKNSKLRAGFENASSAVALQLYADDETTIAEFISEELSKESISIEPDALAIFADELTGDRRLAISEVEKLKLYAYKLGRAVNVEDVTSIMVAEQPKGADVAADAAINGDTNTATTAINRFLEAGGNPISAMRTLHFRMLRVLDAIATDAHNGRRLRPPIFDKEWPAFAKGLKDWNTARTKRALSQLYQAEKNCKQAGAPTQAILCNLILSISKRSV